MAGSWGPDEKDEILRDAFARIARFVATSAWTTTARPFADLRAECVGLRADPGFTSELKAYVRAHTTLPRAIEMLMTCISMAATARWQDAPESLRPIRSRGWFLGRWLPTFLIFDGPIGRFMRSSDSPLVPRYGPGLPVLTGARDFTNDRTFRALQNGFAHWGFDWEVVDGESFVVAYDWERDLPAPKLHQAEADAYHIVAFALVDCLNASLLRASDPVP